MAILTTRFSHLKDYTQREPRHDTHIHQKPKYDLSSSAGVVTVCRPEVATFAANGDGMYQGV